MQMTSGPTCAHRHLEACSSTARPWRKTWQGMITASPCCLGGTPSSLGEELLQGMCDVLLRWRPTETACMTGLQAAASAGATLRLFSCLPPGAAWQACRAESAALGTALCQILGA